MIRKLVRDMLVAQILSGLAVSLCLLIDNIIIGRFLGEESIAAYGLANPLLLVIGAIGTLLAAGIQVICSKSLGRGQQEETDKGYSSGLAIAATLSILFIIIILFFHPNLATLLGAGVEGSLYQQTKDYLIGFSIGAPGSMGAIVLVPFLQMAGQSGLVVMAVIGMTIMDILFDLLNVLVFHGGMFGMGLASAFSYYVAVGIGAFYFLSKKCVFHFALKYVTLQKIKDIIWNGIPSSFNIFSMVILVFSLNQLLKSMGDMSAVAAFSVIVTIGNTFNCLSSGFGGVALTLIGIYYNEEDKTSLKELLQSLSHYIIFLSIPVCLIMILFAPFFVSLFIPNSGNVQKMAILGVRLYALGIMPCCYVNILKSGYQAMEHPFLTATISIFEGAILPLLVAYTATPILGITGAWLYFALGQSLSLLFLSVYIALKTKHAPWHGLSSLLLEDDFGGSDDHLMEANIQTIDEVVSVSNQAAQFCLSYGQSEKFANHIALCIEEMAGNTILHGFTKDNKKHNLSIRVLRKPDSWVLRFRDDCGAFDPVHYIPREGKDALGIRLALAMADEVNYTYSLNLNNLILKLHNEKIT